MITIALLVFPLIAGLFLLAVKPERAKSFAFAAAIIELLISIIAITQFDVANSTYQFLLDIVWVKSLGIHFKVGVDGISMLLILLTTIALPLIVYSGFSREVKNASVFYALMLFMQMALIGVFVALDGFLFYVFWELALLPIWFICLLWGGEKRAKITFKFFIYTLVGSLFMLVSLVFLYLQTPGVHSFEIAALYEAGRAMSAAQQSWVFWGMFIAFAIKMPLFPFHTWQPDTYVVAPTQGTMLLSGIMLKMGTYGLIRWLLPVVPLGVAHWGNTAIILSVISILYASCLAIVQKDFKRLIAYSSIAHVGLIAAGIFSFNQQGLSGALVQMISHGTNVIGLFFIADIIFDKTQTREIAKLGGIRTVSPTFATLFLIVLLGSVALPLTNGFVGEFLLITGVYQYSAWVAVFAGLTVILGAVYMLRSYQSIMLGNTNTVTEKFGLLNSSEKTLLIVISVLILVFGVFPKPLLDIADATVKAYVENYMVWK